MREDVTLTSNGDQIVGQLHIPDGPQLAAGFPGVVVVGPASSVKGQVPTIYAERLVELGYAALAFDHSTYGESGGWPRSDEDPFAKIEDVKNAVTFLTSRAEVDTDRIATVGVCAGGGYATSAAVADRRIKAVATASALHALRDTIVAAGDWRAIMAAAAGAREQYATTGRATHVPFLADGELDVWRENAKKFYLSERNQDPNWRNETLLWSYDKMLQFAAVDTVELLAPTPILIIAGDRAETLDQSRAAFERANEPKELLLLPGGTTSTSTTSRNTSRRRSPGSTPSSRATFRDEEEHEMNRLAGKVAIVTGATQGQGEAHARGIVAEGGRVLVTGVNQDKGASVVSELGAHARYQHLDVVDPKGWADAVECHLPRHDRHCLVGRNSRRVLRPSAHRTQGPAERDYGHGAVPRQRRGQVLHRSRLRR
jgi:fermentation-respiration switch protein FrsA (DUF1100 family)